ncbi:hypothetical protein MnTg02_03123 [bacterium MnTg02]|nr:hypothetical protein MnTg02_03123 [bacterium MnTg02]
MVADKQLRGGMHGIYVQRPRHPANPVSVEREWRTAHHNPV